tara:strand:- start:330 stop:491 length:162 start_codon:yes stop_codon:yes gene_type:complete
LLPEDFLEHATTVTNLQYDRASGEVVVNARAGDKQAKIRLAGMLTGVEWLPAS